MDINPTYIVDSSSLVLWSVFFFTDVSKISLNWKEEKNQVYCWILTALFFCRKLNLRRSTILFFFWFFLIIFTHNKLSPWFSSSQRKPGAEKRAQPTLMLTSKLFLLFLFACNIYISDNFSVNYIEKSIVADHLPCNHLISSWLSPLVSTKV